MKKIPDPLFSQARKNPSRRFLHVKDGLELSYLESDRQVNELVKTWTRLGIRSGSVVACLFEEGPEAILAILALIRIGAIYAPLPVPQPPAALRKQVVRLKARFLIYSNAFEKLLRKEKSFGLKGVALSRLTAEASRPIQDKTSFVFLKKETKGVTAWNLSRHFSLLFTSGSSGLPKIAGHRLGHFWENALASNQRIRFGGKDTWLLRLPLFHVGGISILFRVLNGGGAIHFPSARDKVAESLGDVTHVSLVSTQFRRIAESQSGIKKLSALKAVLLGGGPMPNEILRKVSSSKINLFASYGLTEMSSQAATSRFRNEQGWSLSSIAARPSVQGWLKPLPKVRLRVLKDDTLAVKGPSLFLGYWENGKWRRPFDGRGYFHTGDLGEKNARGEVRILGRHDGLIISGGENIQPEEIENAILKILPVLEVIVVGVPDALYGARPAAFMKWKSRIPKATRIRQNLKRALPSFKIPDFFWKWPADEEKLKTGMKWSRPAFAKLALELSQTFSSPK